MGSCQNASLTWNKFGDAIKFANQLSTKQRTSFLLVLSAICWTIWKYRNDLCFANGTKKSIRQIILLIISLVHYWTGRVHPTVAETIALWLPVELDVLPIASWHPNDVATEETAFCYRQRLFITIPTVSWLVSPIL